MLVGVAFFVLHTPSTSGAASGVNNITAGDSTKSETALDQVSSADIAVHVSMLTNLPETPSVVNKADTVNAQLGVTAADDTVVAKPQVVDTSLKSYKDIQAYTTVAGDTIPSIAAKFGVTSDTVRWSNGLQGDNVQTGQQLFIPPVDGVAYLVKAGDTVDSIVAKFNANKDQLLADNDIEILGLRVGTRILVRGGSITPVRTARSARPSAIGFAWGGAGAIYGSNGYDYGYCTWYVANRRAAAGHPIPSNLGNASTWKALAIRAGLPVGNVPQAGAVIWTPPRDYYGHVGYVESVNADGSVNVSEMNTKGWAKVSTRVVPAADASRYSYIY
jgi:surface antigen